MNRLSREISALRRQAAQAQASASGGEQHADRNGSTTAASFPDAARHDPTAPSVDVMLEAMRRENEQLRTRLVDTERDYVRISRLNDIYREELLELRRRVRPTFPPLFLSLGFVVDATGSSGCRWTIWWG